MTNRFLISVATAALLAGTGFANAQGTGGMKEGGAGSTVQQSAPPAGGGAAQTAPQHRESAPPSSGMKSTQSEKAPAAAKQAEDLKGGKELKTEGREKATVGQAPDKSGATPKGHHDKAGSAMSRDDKMGQKGDMKGEKSSTDTNRAQQNQGTMDNNRAQTKEGGAQTTGTAATSARVAAPPPEKQTQIVSAIKSERIQETNVNVNVSIGT